jgi:hypothetical protein
MNEEEVKTSQDWQTLYPDPLVLDPDGWDRKNFQFSWYEEKITHKEYIVRLIGSTCAHGFKPLQMVNTQTS